MHTDEPMLDHERLEAYKLARQHARESHALISQLPRGRSDVIDQYRRATLSLPLKISEGAGEFAPREKARLYPIAPGARSVARTAGSARTPAPGRKHAHGPDPVP